MCLILLERGPEAKLRRDAVKIIVDRSREGEDYGAYEIRRALGLMSLTSDAVASGVATPKFEELSRCMATGMLRRAESHVAHTPTAGGYLGDITRLREEYNLDPTVMNE